MKTKYLPLAGLFIIGILGASGSAATRLDIAEITQPTKEIYIQLKTIDSISHQHTIAGAIYDELIDIEDIGDDDIQADLINAATYIAA